MDKKALRHTLGGFATGVCVITVPDPDHVSGHVLGMTANSFSSISLDPPLVQWCIDNHAHRYAVYAQAPRFGINILSGKQGELSRRFARHKRQQHVAKHTLAHCLHRPRHLRWRGE